MDAISDPRHVPIAVAVVQAAPGRVRRPLPSRWRQAAILAVLAVALVPGVASASAYGPRSFQALWLVPGQMNNTSVCVQPAILDTAQNYGQIIIFEQPFGSCNPPNRNVPSGFIGTSIRGWRNGAYCGATAWSYSNVSTSAWQVWAQLCDNPSGSQVFSSDVRGKYWKSSGYSLTNWVSGPSQNY